MPVTRRRTLHAAAAAGLSALLTSCRRSAEPATAPAPAPALHGTLRLELRHTMTNGAEGFLLTRLRAEPVGAGSRNTRRAAPDWGDYRLSLYEPGTRALLYRAGFDSHLARDSTSAATRLSVRFPSPERAVEAALEKRRGEAAFHPLWQAPIDPNDSAIDRSPSKIMTRVEKISANRNPQAKANIAILGDGYVDSDHAKFVADAHRASASIFAVEPLKTRMRDFNVNAVFTPSRESGATDPYLGLRNDTVFGCSYGSGDAERTLVVGDENALREAASVVPYDLLLVVVNARRYGGSSYYGGPAVVSIDSAAAPYLIIHEFAHALAGLADEYYIPARDGPVYAGNIEPWNPNVTLSAKHAQWGAADPRPARWNKAEYERYFAAYVRRYFALRGAHADESTIEKFMHNESERQATLLAKNGNRVGLYEGANGYAKGVFRSAPDCVMFSLQTERFCPACASALEQAIDYYVS